MYFVLLRAMPALGAALLLSGCAFDIGDFGNSERYQSDFHYSYDLAPDGRVNVENFNGSVEISGWDENKVDIAGTKYAASEELRDAIQIETHNTSNAVDIRAVRPSSRHGNLGARFVIRVPRGAQLDRVTNSNGQIRVRNVASAAHLKSSNGSIRLEGVGGDVDAHTSNSGIELDGVRGSATLRTSNGRITVDNLTGNCDAETSNSSIKVRLEEAPSAAIRLVTSNGSIELGMEKAPKNDIRAETRNGSITLRLPASTGARLSAETSNSSVTSEFIVQSGSREDDRKRHLDGIIGGGGPRIDLSTRNGHIRIVKTYGN
jgi:DUF4097 and DUF4098 domain-containing protein YvlB